jgi:hypothetical protein
MQLLCDISTAVTSFSEQRFYLRKMVWYHDGVLGAGLNGISGKLINVG